MTGNLESKGIMRKASDRFINLDKFLKKHNFTLGNSDPDPHEYCSMVGIWDYRFDPHSFVPGSVEIVEFFRLDLIDRTTVLERVVDIQNHCRKCGMAYTVIYEATDHLDCQCACGDRIFEFANGFKYRS